MNGIFVSPGTPRWVPMNESDIQAGIDGKLLEESHWVDLKREIELGRAANRELARDLASFAIDGGTYIVGIAESGSGFILAPQLIGGLAERVEQVARSIPDPPLAVVSRSITSAVDESLGYLVVSVPPSGQAPHMVDHRYIGRGDKTKIYLSDAEVLRLHERRRSAEKDVLSLLNIEIARDPVLVESRRMAHLFLVAVPFPGRSEMALELVSGEGWAQRIVELRDYAMRRSVTESTGLDGFYPDLNSAHDPQRRPHGAALAPSGLRRSSVDGGDQVSEARAVELELSEDGQINIFCGRASDFIVSASIEQEFLFDQGVIVFLRRLLASAIYLSDQVGYHGNWGLGVALTGLREVRSYESTKSFTSEGQAYGDDAYKRSLIASYAELTQMPGRLTQGLLGRLLRALGTDQILIKAMTDQRSE